MERKITQHLFGQAHGQNVIQTVMQNGRGMRFASCTYGATITEIAVPNQAGLIENVVCSFERVEDYLFQPQFFGSTIGPFAGRLENSELVINGQSLHVTPNEGKHLLHGGNAGFHTKIWHVETFEEKDRLTTKYSLTYDEEFPGDLQIEVCFSLLETNEVVVTYSGVNSEDTLLNCTNHSYFNLSGNLKETIHNHTLKMNARRYIPINKHGLPLGKPLEVEDTVFDFTQVKPLSAVIGATDKQVCLASGGLDHTFLLDEGIITLTDSNSGRQLIVVTQEPAVVVYTGNKIGSGYSFKEANSKNFLGICLEEQNVPNSIKYPQYPSAFLAKDTPYSKTTTYKFEVI
ncbi:aldose epimerase family protein [Solibacillus sp. FSL H8-0523]|uniref:aldose epimerase family protein n=1 Tax=Solibacillus sp. FSL H8-0523 TaxID=2954511 RepID=UPI0031015355